MKNLAEWLQNELRARGLTQAAASTYAGVSPATLSLILAQGHIPNIDILFRLADYFEMPREQVLRLAARMPLKERDSWDEEDYLIEELLEEFRQVPDEWKPVAVQQVNMFRRLAEMPPARFIGDEDEDDDPEEPST